MMKTMTQTRDEAIAICRVSTPEQKLSNSLNRQEESVLNAAKRLEVKVVRTWSGDASSKVGKNVKRKDLLEAFEFCKNNQRVKYLIVDEVDRFMRSTGEMFYWITKFDQEAGVQVYFASNPDHNTADAKARLLLSLEGFKAEGSNEERQHKSISGHEKAIREGRYTFPPKPGYMKGTEPGVHIPHPVTFKPLQKAFREVASGLYTPTEALKRLRNTEFSQVYRRWNMDKFRHFGIDPYYAGILEINAQVHARNENGLHEPMLSREEHRDLVAILTDTYRPRGAKKQYNPEFPMNKIMHCGDCGGEVKFTGSKKSNGYAKKTTHYYYKYHCRGCNRSYHRDEVHSILTDKFRQLQYTGRQRDEFIKALETVWQQKQRDKLLEIQSTEKRLEKLQETKSKLVLEMVRADDSYKSDIAEELDKVKDQISELESSLDQSQELGEDLVNFVKFGLEYTNDLMDDWWNLDHDERVRCQQLVFPGGITFNSQKKVGTHQISSLYSLERNKKDLSFSEKSLMVELRGIAPRSESSHSTPLQT